MTALRRLFRSRRRQVTRHMPPSGWVQPWWVECWREQNNQMKGDIPGSNKVARSWTLLGNLESVHRVAVDSRGLIAVKPGYWSLDWWLRVDDHWIFPSRHEVVRQRLVEGAPVVETLIRAAGGDLVHRVYAARVNSEQLIVEVENQGSRPVALAWAIRPYDHLGGGRIEQIKIDDRSLYVDGQAAFVCGRTPGRLIGGTGGLDPAAMLDLEEASEEIACNQGMASAAVIMPLVHGATARGVIPLGVSAEPETTIEPPSGTQVARGWNSHAVNASRFVLPGGNLSDLFHASRQSILLSSTGEDIVPAPGGPPHTAGDEAALLLTLAEAGYRSTVRDIFVGRAKRQTPLGAVTHAGMDVTAATISAVDRALELAPDKQLLEGLGEFVADGARWILAHPDDDATAGLLSAREILMKLGADKAATELGELIPAQIEPERSVNRLAAPVDALETSRAIFDQLAIDPEGALLEMQRLALLASPTMTWPTFIDPRTKKGTAGAGHDLRVTGWFVRSVLRLLVDDSTSELRFALAWPREWLGQGVEVHGVPSRHGHVSWAVRWHADRPALLWEVEGGSRDLPIRIPGLDSGFEGKGCVGETLLAAVEVGSRSEADGDDGRGSTTSGSFS